LTVLAADVEIFAAIAKSNNSIIKERVSND
jgi:hypothetical protein